MTMTSVFSTQKTPDAIRINSTTYYKWIVEGHFYEPGSLSVIDLSDISEYTPLYLSETPERQRSVVPLELRLGMVISAIDDHQRITTLVVTPESTYTFARDGDYMESVYGEWAVVVSYLGITEYEVLSWGVDSGETE